MTTVEKLEEPIANLPAHAAISITFRVEHVLDVAPIDGGVQGISMTESSVETPWIKDCCSERRRTGREPEAADC